MTLSLTPLKKMGLRQDTTLVAAEAAIAGAQIVLRIHGASPEVLQMEFKANAGMTPKTVADDRSGKKMKQIVRLVFDCDAINEEESGWEAGNNRTWFIDPLDGTSSFAFEQCYSTNGVVVYDGPHALSAAICNPFERELLVAEASKGAFLFELGPNLGTTNRSRKLELPDMAELTGGCVFMDALFNARTTGPKTELMRRLVELSGNNLGFRMTGSNIDQQRQVAAGRAQLTITDAVGGFWDLAVGAMILQEAGGIVLDGQTGEAVTEKAQVAIGGPINLVNLVLPDVQRIYHGYAGFK